MFVRRIRPPYLSKSCTCYTPAFPSCPRRALSSAPAPTPTPKHTLAILGGGLSGLSSAYFFLKALTPEARKITRIVVLEKQDRTGGWCKSVRVDRDREFEGRTTDRTLSEGKEKEQEMDKETMVFETGPRSIRPVGLQGWLTIDMVRCSSSSPFPLPSFLILFPPTLPGPRHRSNAPHSHRPQNGSLRQKPLRPLPDLSSLPPSLLPPLRSPCPPHLPSPTAYNPRNPPRALPSALKSS